MNPTQTASSGHGYTGNQRLGAAAGSQLPEPTMSDFDLNALVRDVCTTSTETHPDALASEVFARVGVDDLPDALMQALVIVVRKFVSRDHRPLNSSVSHTLSGAHTGRADRGITPYRSRKVSSIRSAWARRCEARVNVGAGEWKFFGDCEIDDLAYMVTYRRSLAAQNEAVANNLEHISDEMTRLKVKRVRDLPESSITELGEAA